MATLFFLLSFISIIFIIIGLINPKLVIKWGSTETRNRKKVLGYFGASFLIFFILFIAFTPSEFSETDAQTNQVTTETKVTPVENRSDRVDVKERMKNLIATGSEEQIINFLIDSYDSRSVNSLLETLVSNNKNDMLESILIGNLATPAIKSDIIKFIDQNNLEFNRLNDLLFAFLDDKSSYDASLIKKIFGKIGVDKVHESAKSKFCDTLEQGESLELLKRQIDNYASLSFMIEETEQINKTLTDYIELLRKIEENDELLDKSQIFYCEGYIESVVQEDEISKALNEIFGSDTAVYYVFTLDREYNEFFGYLPGDNGAILISPKHIVSEAGAIDLYIADTGETGLYTNAGGFQSEMKHYRIATQAEIDVYDFDYETAYSMAESLRLTLEDLIN